MMKKVWFFGLLLPAALLAGVIGNMIPVPFVILFIRKVFQWARDGTEWSHAILK